MSFTNQQQKVFNTLTGRWIKRDGATYKKLISNGHYHRGDSIINELEKIYKDTTVSNLKIYYLSKIIKQMEMKKNQQKLMTELVEEFSYHPLYVNNLLNDCGDWKLIKVNH